MSNELSPASTIYGGGRALAFVEGEANRQAWERALQRPARTATAGA